MKTLEIRDGRVELHVTEPTSQQRRAFELIDAAIPPAGLHARVNCHGRSTTVLSAIVS